LLSFVALAGVTILTAGAALTACSGSSEPETLGRAELVARAGSICRRANERVARVTTPDPLDAPATAAALGDVVDEQRAALRRLRRLVPPEADAPDFDRWLTQIDLALDQADRSRRAILAGDPQGAGEANRRGDAIRADADRFAIAYGMTACAQPASAPAP
jgi:hypothetical protein